MYLHLFSMYYIFCFFLTIYFRSNYLASFHIFRSNSVLTFTHSLTFSIHAYPSFPSFTLILSQLSLVFMQPPLLSTICFSFFSLSVTLSLSNSLYLSISLSISLSASLNPTLSLSAQCCHSECWRNANTEAYIFSDLFFIVDNMLCMHGIMHQINSNSIL